MSASSESSPLKANLLTLVSEELRPLQNKTTATLGPERFKSQIISGTGNINELLANTRY